MTTSDYPWEPPMAGAEAEHLAGALDRVPLRMLAVLPWPTGISVRSTPRTAPPSSYCLPSDP